MFHELCNYMNALLKAIYLKVIRAWLMTPNYTTTRQHWKISLGNSDIAPRWFISVGKLSCNVKLAADADNARIADT